MHDIHIKFFIQNNIYKTWEIWKMIINAIHDGVFKTSAAWSRLQLACTSDGDTSAAMLTPTPGEKFK